MKHLLALSLLAAAAIGMNAAEQARWLRDAAISPDGSTIAFTYKGDIFTVSAKGGQALQITSNSAYDAKPMWTPDGKSIVFTSNREGSDDIFITSALGGTPRRLTTSSGTETPLTFINGNTLLINATGIPGRNSIRAPFNTQVFSINVDLANPRPKLFLSLPVLSANANSKGEILYQDRKSVENIWRKHERSSGPSDIWLYDNGKYTQLTDFNGADQSPVWGTGNTYYFTSEQDGTLNVFEGNTASKGFKQLTKFEKHPVRSLSASDNGILAFSWDGDLYTLKPGQQPVKLSVTVNVDNYDSNRVKNYVTSGAGNIAVDPDGKQIAFFLRGDLYVTGANNYRTTKRITDTPWQERTASFSADGKTIVFDSDENGIWKLYTAKIKDSKEKDFVYATDIVIEPLYECTTSAMQPVFSPDGKKVAFLEDRTELKVIDVDTKKVTTALDGKFNYSYTDGDIDFTWSPDSRYLLVPYIGYNGWNNIDVAIVKADGSEVVNLTESGHSVNNAKFVLGGKAVTYQTSKYGMKAQGSWGNQEDIMLMVLDPETWETFNFNEEDAKLAEDVKKEEQKEAEDAKSSKDKKGKKNTKKVEAPKAPEFAYDFANRRYRIARLTGRSGSYGDYFLSPKGDKLYYVTSSPEGQTGLYVKDLKKGDVRRVVNDISGALIPDKKGEVLFVNTWYGLKKITIANSDVANIEFEAPYDRHPSLEREYIFNHMAKQVEDKFYDANLHGVDWKYYTDHYREFLPYINNNRDFAIILSEVLGELNASHTGGGYRGGGAPLNTAVLGAYFDENYDGDGLKVEEIMPRGPLAAKSAGIVPGDIILSIDGAPIKAGEDYIPLLEGKDGKKVRIAVRHADGKETTATVRPMSLGSQSEMAYQRWVERNEQIVDSLSGGKIGYAHVRGMDGGSYQTVYDRILGKYRNCDAVIIDTRHNGGGWLHNDLAILLSGKKYSTFKPRGRRIGQEPFAQWYKPSVMLVDESNYSDAHGSPYTYQTLGIGEVIGAPIPGTMTAVWWETQIDPSIYFGIPQVTNVSNDGTILENHQLNPDVIIYNAPADLEAGKDAQLEGAVKRLMEKTKK